ncbi:MAG: hypothetical protein WCK86_20345, partial [Planctomycetia bacterium]
MPAMPASLLLSLLLVAGIRIAEALQWSARFTFPAVLSGMLLSWYLRDRAPRVSGVVLYAAVLLMGSLM